MEGDHQPAAGKVQDVVCGMWVDPGKARGKAEYGGKTFYFCSPRCEEKFKADPAALSQPKPAAGLVQLGKHNARRDRRANPVVASAGGQDAEEIYEPQ